VRKTTKQTPITKNLPTVRKTILFATVVACVALIYSCQHQPFIIPEPNGTGDTIQPPPPPPQPVSNCNPDSVYFENDILPLLASNCGMPGCHDAASHAEGINVTTYTSLINSKIIVAGKPANSKLIKSVNETNPNDIMPRPPRAPLTADQKAKLEKWIAQGALNNKCNSGCDTTQFKFTANILPIITENCKGCHSGSFPSGNVSLENYTQIKTQADNGQLLGTINYTAGYKPMPQGTNKLADCKITIISKWIQAGAQNN
jgi:hypothetical protein